MGLVLSLLIFWALVFIIIGIITPTKEQEEKRKLELLKKREEKRKEWEERRWLQYPYPSEAIAVNRDSEGYKQLLLEPEWKEKRLQILKRDNYKCTCCGNTGILQVHHKEYRIENGHFIKPWDYPNDCLITLCEKCHEKIHSSDTKIPIVYI